jgi:hypothetical protein
VSNFQGVWRYGYLKLALGYVHFLQNGLPLLLEEISFAKRMRAVFQDRGASARYGHLITRHLNLTSPWRWIDRGVRVQWPPKSPDLTPLDFCLWGWMKSEVYRENVNTRDQLVARTMSSAALLKQERQDDLRTNTLTVVKRAENCIRVHGGIFEHLLWTVAIYGGYLHYQ